MMERCQHLHLVHGGGFCDFPLLSLFSISFIFFFFFYPSIILGLVCRFSTPVLFLLYI